MRRLARLTLFLLLLAAGLTITPEGLRVAQEATREFALVTAPAALRGLTGEGDPATTASVVAPPRGEGEAAPAPQAPAPTPAVAPTPSTAARPALAPAVTVARAETREIVERVVVTGTLVPREEIMVTPEIEGLRINEILVEEGDKVARGRVLARLSRDLLDAQAAQNAATLARATAGIEQARSQIVQAEAANTEAQAALERARSLLRSGNTTEAVIEQRVAAARAAEGRLSATREGLRIAEAGRLQAQAQGSELQVRIARTEIRAPAAGLVARRNARLGATATAAGDPLFRIIADGQIELEGDVTETQLSRLREGMPAEVAIDQARPVVGRVRLVRPEVDRATRLGRVRVALPAGEGLRIGAFARGSVELARRTGVAVPLSALVYGREGASLLAIDGERVRERRVRMGLQAEGFVEIAEGLQPGELVVARAGSFLRDGDAVRPVLPTEAVARAGGVKP